MSMSMNMSMHSHRIHLAKSNRNSLAKQISDVHQSLLQSKRTSEVAAPKVIEADLERSENYNLMRQLVLGSVG